MLGVEAQTKLPLIADAMVSITATLVIFKDGDIQFSDYEQGQNKTHACFGY